MNPPYRMVRIKTLSTVSIFWAISSVAAGEKVDSLPSLLQTISEPRILEDNDDYFPYDLSQFSVRFEKCQPVKSFDDDLAADEDSETVLAVRNYVVYSLCPSDSCQSCDGVHGKYALDIATYMQSTAENQREKMESMCKNCQDGYGYDDDAYTHCTTECCETCREYNNMENNGYIDASEYTECQQVNAETDDDGGNFQLYAGPQCSSDSFSVEIGLFTDENCGVPYDGDQFDLESVLGSPLSYILLEHTGNADGAACLSCKEQDDNENDNDQNDADDVNEMCENIYDGAAKCESNYGIEYGFIQTAQDNDEYENQVENEYMSCTFIENLIANSYTESGEINVGDVQDEVLRVVTHRQALALSGLVVVICAIFGGGYYYQRQIDKLQPAPRLLVHPGASLT